MKNKDMRYAIALAFLVIFITGGLYILLQTRQAVYGSVIDWLGQHVAFPEYFRDYFYQTGSLYPDFSLQLGAGQNMAEFVYYGLMRPEILLSYFLPIIKMSTYMTFSSILITILSVELFYYWIRKQNISEFIAFFAAVIFLCAGPILYHTHRHVMFVNYMPWLILTFIGIQRYLQKQKSDIMLTGIVLMIMASFFYSVSGLFFCGIYAVYEIIRQDKSRNIIEFIRLTAKLAAHVLLGIGISCFLLIPTAYMMLSQHRPAMQKPTLLELFTPDLDISSLSYTAYFSNAYAAGMCVITWCAVLYFIQRRNKSSRLLGVLTLLVIIFPVFCYFLNGFQYVREKSLIPIIPLAAYMVAVMLADMKISKRKYFLLLLFMLLPIIFIKENRMKLLFVIDAILCASLLYINFYTRKKRYIVIYLLFPLLLLLPSNETENYLKQSDLKRYENVNKKEQVKQILDQDTGLYRFDDFDFALRTSNQVLDTRMYKTTVYSSNKNLDYSNFVSNVMGMPGDSANNANITTGKNAFFQSLMSVKYIYTTDKTIPLNYRRKNTDGNAYIIENADVMPMAYASSSILSQSQFEQLSYPYSMEAIYMNSIVENAEEKSLKTQTQQVQLPYEIIHMDSSIHVKKTKTGYKFNVKSKGEIQIKLKKAIYEKLLILDFPIRDVAKKNTVVSIAVNGLMNKRGADGDIYTNHKDDFRYVLEQNKAWDNITITLEKGTFTVHDPKAYLVDSSILKERSSDVDPLVGVRRQDSNGLSGSINVKENGYFITSLPYQKGFRVLLDGKRIDYEKVNTAFVGFPITKGKHTVDISYQMPGKKEGIIVSSISILISFACYRNGKKDQYREKKEIVHGK